MLSCGSTGTRWAKKYGNCPQARAIRAKNPRFAVSPGYTDEIIHFYYANEFKNGTVHLDDDEFLTCEWIDINRAYEMADNGEIYDAKTLVAIYRHRAGLIKAAK